MVSARLEMGQPGTIVAGEPAIRIQLLTCNPSSTYLGIWRLNNLAVAGLEIMVGTWGETELCFPPD